MRDWVLGIFAASLLGALALALCPPGRVRTITKMVCGVVCALAVASPLLELDTASLARGMAEYRRQAEILAAGGEEEGKMLERTYIEEECAAYICAKAAEKGAEIDSASVLARWDDGDLVWYPWSVTVDGGYSAALAAVIEGDLGVPPERQEWSEDG